MSAMWERRLLSTLIAVLLTWVGTRLDVQGYGVYAMIAVIVLVAMLAGIGAETWLRGRRRRSLS